MHPLIFTEWGYWSETEFGPQIKAIIEDLGASWTAWCVSYDWGPPMFNHDWTPNHFGNFVKTWLAEKKDSNQPSGSGPVPVAAPKAGARSPVSPSNAANTFACYDMRGNSMRQPRAIARFSSGIYIKAATDDNVAFRRAWFLQER
jgi:hypothetical protein